MRKVLIADTHGAHVVKRDGAIVKIVPPKKQDASTDALDCPECGSPMTMMLRKKVGSKTPRRNKWNVRRFECACGYKITVHGNGRRDLGIPL